VPQQQIIAGSGGQLYDITKQLRNVLLQLEHALKEQAAVAVQPSPAAVQVTPAESDTAPAAAAASHLGDQAGFKVVSFVDELDARQQRSF